MASLTHRVDTKAVTLSVKLPRAFGARMWMSVALIRLAALIAPFTIEIETCDD